MHVVLEAIERHHRRQARLTVASAGPRVSASAAIDTTAGASPVRSQVTNARSVPTDGSSQPTPSRARSPPQLKALRV